MIKNMIPVTTSRPIETYMIILNVCLILYMEIRPETCESNLGA
jgi:hypothetical protein